MENAPAAWLASKYRDALMEKTKREKIEEFQSNMKVFRNKLNDDLKKHIGKIIDQKPNSIISIKQMVMKRVDELKLSGYLKNDELDPKFDFHVTPDRIIKIVPLNLQAQKVLQQVYGPPKHLDVTITVKK